MKTIGKPGPCATYVALLLFVGVLWLQPDAALAQNKPFDPPTNLAQSNSDIGFRAGSIVAAPIPFESPSLGTGLALGGGYLFKNDRLSDTSSLGFGGFKSSNDSYGVGLGLNLSWNSDRWTVQTLLADADLNYDLYLGERQIPVRQSLRGLRLKLGYSPVPKYSFGGSLDYGEYTLSRQQDSALPEIFEADADLEIARFSAFANYDSRDDTFYPTRGIVLSGTGTVGSFVGSDRDEYSKLVLSGGAYAQVLERGVLAAHAVACTSSSDAPFFDSCSLGTTDNFRGYIATEFLDDALVSFQAEYRGQVIGRLGFVVFAGAGAVDDSLSAAVSGDFESAFGAGLRIRLSKQFPLDYAIDVSSNQRGEQLLYVSVGQRF